ncbi:unnamed protein product [Microthlaspi erraticum]|uniref:Uncharacterized protein n=1 Tax=Microthlaspi erraticum TaxID=1685480 RepID=A0A6D2IM73_9BRAS|nr:unnamed protein product [Microthlaspi erraticum]
MRIEGEKGVKTQSAPKHWPRTRKSDFGRAILNWPTVTVEPGRNSRARPDSLCATETVRAHARTGKETRDRPKFSYRNGPTVPVDPGNIARPRPKSLDQTNLADQIARPRQNPSAIGPNFSRPR